MWLRFADSICIVLTCRKICTKCIFSLTASYFCSTASLCTAAFIQYSFPGDIKLTLSGVCIPFRSKYMSAILDDHFPSHLCIVRLFFFWWCCTGVKVLDCRNAFTMCCGANWLFDTIVMYQIFSQIVFFKILSLSSDSKHRVSNWCWEKGDKNLWQ